MGPTKREQIHARDGDDCWWCFRSMDFSTKPRKSQSPTIEHLQPKALGGGNSLDNLVLCHPGCNRQLADRPRLEKVRLRNRRMRRMERAAAAAIPAVQDVNYAPRPMSTAKSVQRDWRTIALIAIAAAIFFAGLSLGMAIR